MFRMTLAAAALFTLSSCTGEAPVATDPVATDPAAAPAAAAEPVTAPEPAGKSVDAAAFAKYVPWNSAMPEVVKTGSGMEYVVLASGPAEGATPNPAQSAEIYYEGRLNAGGAAFDSAFDRGETATFPVGSVVPGFSEALQLMRPGDRWLVYIPSELGYGARGAGGVIPPDAALVFEIDMVAVR